MRRVGIAIAAGLFWLRRVLAFVGFRGWRTVARATPLKALVACEACEREEATVRVPSSIEDRDVWLCEWCYRRFRKANRAHAIPKTRRPKSRPPDGVRKGGPGGRAA